MSAFVNTLANLGRDLLWLAGLLLLGWLFPKTVLALEALCALATLALLFLERAVR